MADTGRRGSKLEDWYHDAAALVPGYRDLFGAKKGLDELLSLVRRHPVADWFSFLSRIQSLLAPPHGFNVERHKAVVGGLFSSSMRGQLDKWVRSQNRRARLCVFAEPQLATLQELVLMHAPEHGEFGFETPADRDELVEALLITWDLMHWPKDPTTPDEAFTAIMQSHARTFLEDAFKLAARAVYAYQLLSMSPPPAIKQLRKLFEAVTGVSMQDYLVGGMAVAVREYGRSPDEVAEAWFTAPPAEKCENPLEARCLDAFYQVRSASVDEVREAVQHFDGDLPVHAYSLIGLYQYPVVDFPGQGRFVTNLAALSNALMAGIRFALLDAVRDEEVPGWSPQRLNGVWGTVFEEYILDLLESAFGERLVRLTESRRGERADCLVVYPNKVLVIEVKGTHTTGIIHRGLLTLQEREQELRKLRIPKAASQLTKTISDLHEFRIEDDRLIEYDWTVTTVVPVVVTYERLPLFPKLFSMYQRVTDVLDALPLQDQMAPVRFLSVADVEQLPDLAQATDVGSALLSWARDRVGRECSFPQYLHLNDIRHDDALSRARVRNGVAFLASEIGLDARQILDTDFGEE